LKKITLALSSFHGSLRFGTTDDILCRYVSLVENKVDSRAYGGIGEHDVHKEGRTKIAAPCTKVLQKQVFVVEIERGVLMSVIKIEEVRD